MSAEKNILIEEADEHLKLITEKELKEIEDSAEEFDGFTGIRVVGRLKDKHCIEVSSLHYSELKYALLLAHSLIGHLHKLTSDPEAKSRIEKFKIICSGLEDSSIHKAQEIFKLLRGLDIGE